MALKTLLENHSKRKIPGLSKSFYGVPLISFKVDTTIDNLTNFSTSLGYTYNLLKIFNPWLRKNRLSNPTKKYYIINFPKKEYLKNGFTYFEGDLVRENRDSSVLEKGIAKDTLSIPIDSDKEEKTLMVPSKKDTEKNEQPH